MDEHITILTIHVTFNEVVALVAAAQIYLDILEVVRPLERDKTRLESIRYLEAFKKYYQEMRDEGQEPTDTLLSLQIPFQEVIVLTTAIEAYEFLDKIYCVPTSSSGLHPIDVMALTRSFQRRLVSISLETSL